MKKKSLIFVSLLIVIGLIAGCLFYKKVEKYIPTASQDSNVLLSTFSEKVNFPKSFTPSEIQEIKQHQPIQLVKVYKAQRTIQLLHQNEIIREYPIRLGFDPLGHKVQEGDGKTPEGRYILDWRNPKSAFYKSLHVSYPNERDKATASALGVSPGGDIMIHGSATTNQINKLPSLMEYFPRNDWTWGCVAVRNVDMDEIWQLVEDGTPIEIYP